MFQGFIEAAGYYISEQSRGEEGGWDYRVL
jgi:hypothetical protein